MSLFLILSLLILGLVLILGEIIFIPGITIFGILGFICFAVAIYFSYQNFGRSYGHITLVASFISYTLLVVLSLRNKSWKKFSLTQTIEGRVNESQTKKIKIGDKGITTSSLKPIGKAEIENLEIEVRTQGTFMKENEKIEVTHIEGNKIFVKPIN